VPRRREQRDERDERHEINKRVTVVCDQELGLPAQPTFHLASLMCIESPKIDLRICTFGYDLEVTLFSFATSTWLQLSM
jgi:hypothetical protein